MKNNKNTFVFLGCSIFILILGLFLAVSLGVTQIGISDIWFSIVGNSGELEQILIRDVRIPRVLTVLFTGGILGVTGAMLQGITRNPIAEPSFLGVSQGATLVIAILYALGISITTPNVFIAAFLGALVCGLIVIGFLSTKANNRSITRILLAGMAMSTFFLSLTTMIGLLSNQAQLIGFWVAGGFRNATWSDAIMVIIIGTAGLILAVLFAQKINILSLGDDVAISMGINPEKIRLIILLAIIPMTAAAVAAGKNIGFVGLIIPQIVRKLVGEDYRKNIPFAFLLGGVLLTYADIAARLIFDPYETPIGIFTAFIGVPFFLVLARREKG
ncbi:MAG: ferrichrome transporter permease [Herbinix sp.]|jgi:iron complex transport system permease protein|nr:ferrichrome transporter permease [Herbinix sp.]